MSEDEVEGLDPREEVCRVCNLAHWTAAGRCPTCAVERPGLALVGAVKGGLR